MALLKIVENFMKVDRLLKMKVRSKKKPLTFGDFVAGVYRTWGEQKAAGIIQLAVKMHIVEFRGSDRFVVA